MTKKPEELGVGTSAAAMLMQLRLFQEQMEMFQKNNQTSIQENEKTLKMMQEQMELVKKQTHILEQIANPFYFGVFHSDHLYDEPLLEQTANVKIAETDHHPEAGYVFFVNITFFGAGGKLCSGRMQIDGASIEFPTIQSMHQVGITEPIQVGFYVSSYDVGHEIYGVSWTTNYPIPFQDQFRIFISNENPRTAAGTNNVTYNLTATRFRKDASKIVGGRKYGYK